ncbi:MAG: YraN family protein [Lachnospiraceae bacterium]|nr:YraN family protein [Lachnospiraceae bacterium]
MPGNKNTSSIGKEYEEMAAVYLKENGYHLIERNFRCRAGEIDIIAQEGRYLVFAEVKYRSSDLQGGPLPAVSREKQRRISRAALWYLTKKHLGEDTPCRFDVIGITPDGIQIIRDAFPYQG